MSSQVVYDKWDAFDGRFGHLFYKTPFSHYVLAVEYRFLGQQVKGGPDWGFRNSGVMLHGQPAETMGKDQDFPISIEGQLLGGAGDGKRPLDREPLHARHERGDERHSSRPRTASTRARRPSTATSGCASSSRSTATARSSTG